MPCAELTDMPRCNNNSIPRLIEPSALLGSPLRRRYRLLKLVLIVSVHSSLLISAASTGKKERPDLGFVSAICPAIL